MNRIIYVSIVIVLVSFFACSIDDIVEKPLVVNCSSPFDLQLEKIANVSIKLTWQDSCNSESGFIIERKSQGGNYTELKRKAADATSHVDLVYDLDSRAYSYRIQSFNDSTESNYSNEVNTPEIPISEGVYPHLIYHPASYTQQTDSLYGLLIFLHGAGERGMNLERVKWNGIPKLINQGMEFPTVVVSPQCPSNVSWTSERLELTLENILVNNRIDENRIYLTGLSMGGFGTWDWSVRHPEHFAALVPICGGGDPTKVSTIKDLPIWVFHGALDNVVPLASSQVMVDSLRAIGGDPKFTIYPNTGHDSWTETYDNMELFNWLFTQTK